VEFFVRGSGQRGPNAQVEFSVKPTPRDYRRVFVIRDEADEPFAPVPPDLPRLDDVSQLGRGDHVGVPMRHLEPYGAMSLDDSTHDERIYNQNCGLTRHRRTLPSAAQQEPRFCAKGGLRTPGTAGATLRTEAVVVGIISGEISVGVDEVAVDTHAVETRLSVLTHRITASPERLTTIGTALLSGGALHVHTRVRDAISRNTCLSVFTDDVEARILDADAALAEKSCVAISIVTGVLTVSLDAQETRVASHLEARVLDAETVFADHPDGARHLATGHLPLVQALTQPTGLSVWTVDTRTRVVHALPCDADIFPLTLHAFTSDVVLLQAHALAADLPVGAVEPEASVDQTEPFAAVESTRALPGRALLGALTLHTAASLHALRVLVDLAVAIAVHGVAHIRAQLTALPAGVDDPLVDLAIAIIVRAVAQLLGNESAGPALIGDALVHLPVAIVVHSVANLRRFITAATTTIGHVLIDLPVAVVVRTVADLLGCLSAEAARVEDTLIHLPVAIVVYPIADLFRGGSAGTTAIDQPLIDQPITVIVQSITDLVGYGTTVATRVGDAVVDQPITVIVFAVADLLGDLAARSAGVHEPLVCEAVTVVVFPVADLLGHLAAQATRVQQALVAEAVAVIVEPIAHLLGRGAALTTEIGDTLVDSAVTVVVAPITDLGPRCLHRAADKLPPVAHPLSVGTDTLQPCVARITTTWIPVVHYAIAVVVEAVAHLGLRLADTFHGQVLHHRSEKVISGEEKRVYLDVAPLKGKRAVVLHLHKLSLSQLSQGVRDPHADPEGSLIELLARPPDPAPLPSWLSAVVRRAPTTGTQCHTAQCVSGHVGIGVGRVSAGWVGGHR
jgi:hypothetical protein